MKKSFKEVLIEGNGIEYMNNLSEKKLLIYSKTSIEKINFINKNIRMIDWHDISKNKEGIDEFVEKIEKSVDEIVSFGGGSVIDISKYISYKLKIKHTCILSMLSTNSFATDKVALMKEGKKVTYNAKIPSVIILDKDILKYSTNENLYGLVDVLSIYTALEDWKIAYNDISENMDWDIYNRAQDLLLNTLKFIKNTTYSNIKKRYIEIFNFIGESGLITNLYGTGRPESGSEHILAKKLEAMKEMPHGISVSVGILIMSMMQDRYNEEIENAIIKMRIFKECKKYGITPKYIFENFKNLDKRIDRYSIIDKKNLSDEQKLKIVEKIYKIIGENQDDNIK